MIVFNFKRNKKINKISGSSKEKIRPFVTVGALFGPPMQQF